MYSETIRTLWFAAVEMGAVSMQTMNPENAKSAVSIPVCYPVMCNLQYYIFLHSYPNDVLYVSILRYKLHIADGAVSILGIRIEENVKSTVSADM